MRLATPADLPVIRDIVTAAYTRYLDRMDRPPAPMLADYAAEVESGRLWVAGDPVTGLVELIENAGSLHIANVAVHPAAQGTGLGRRLMEFAEEQARHRGRLPPRVHGQNPALTGPREFRPTPLAAFASTWV
jgi:GNAT superfamily N-acetyltransferase